MNKVAIYCRLSEEDRDKKNQWDESESIQNQKSMLIHYCFEKGWEIYKIYCDEDYSGADKKRPEWIRLINDCECGKIDIVLCKTQSRFSRDMEIIERYIHNKFLEWNVRFVSVVDHADTQADGNKKARQINGLINEWYLEDLSDNIRRTLMYKKKNGQWTGSFTPYGYQLDPNNKHHFIVDPVASEIVKTIFRMYAGGMGYLAIAEYLNNQSIPNPTLYKRLNGSRFQTNGLRKSCDIWTDNTIYFILRQEVYIGVLVQGKSHSLSYKNHKRVFVPKKDWIRCPGTHQAIIDKELWNTVQQRIKAKARSSFANVVDNGSRHVLSNKVYCAECGSMMYKTSSTGKNGRYEYLKCKTSKTDANSCDNNKFIRLDSLQNLILTQINAFVSKYYNPKQIQLPTQSELRNKQQVLKSEKVRIENDIAMQNKLSYNLYLDKVNGQLSNDAFINYQKSNKADLTKLEKCQKTIERQLANLKSEFTKQNACLPNNIKYPQLTHELINEFVDCVYVGTINKNGTREITIKWNFA